MRRLDAFELAPLAPLLPRFVPSQSQFLQETWHQRLLT
jgi:hypothetical protein